MIYLTQLIYLTKGQEDVLNAFEAITIPLILKYNGNLLMRLRPSFDSIIEGSAEKPYELHIVSFNSESDFQNFLDDEERHKVMHLKEQSTREVILIKGIKV